MAFTQDEADRLKGFTKEIIDQEYVPILHELRKKLTIATSKEQELIERLDRYEKDLDKYKGCHDCHRLTVEFKEATTQTNQEQDQKLSCPTDLTASAHESPTVVDPPPVGTSSTETGHIEPPLASSGSKQPQPSRVPAKEKFVINLSASTSQQPQTQKATSKVIEVIDLSD